MRKKILFLLCILLSIFSINTFAETEYKDSIADIVNVPKENGKINLYFFYGDGCHVCSDNEIILDELKQTYSNSLNIYSFEVWHNEDNYNLLEKAVTPLGYEKSDGVPITVINDTLFVGYADLQKENIEEIIIGFINNYDIESNNNYNLPILGNVDAKNVSIPLVSIILGFIDGFNPCAMWILLLLISLFLGMNDRKKALILGITFLFISALVYFLSMFGINFVLDIFNYVWLKTIVAMFILIAGFLNLRKYIKTRKTDIGCEVVNDNKRKTIISRSKKIISEKNFLLSLIGIIILAISVNSLELLCSLGFPVIFAEILSLNEIIGVYRIAYILLYVLFYMLDDIIVFTISMVTLKATGISNRYNKICTLISSIIMILIGILLILKPSWLMLNF